MNNRDNEKNIGLPGDDERLGSTLAKELTATDATPCPEPEELAAVVENTAPPTVKDRLLKHIASCPDCYDTFMMTAELHWDTETEQETLHEADNIEELPIESIIMEKYTTEKKPWFHHLPTRTLALAASVLIIVFSYYLYHQSDEVAKTPRALFEKEAATPQQSESLTPEMKQKLEEQRKKQEQLQMAADDQAQREQYATPQEMEKEALPKKEKEPFAQSPAAGRDEGAPSIPETKQYKTQFNKNKRIIPTPKPAAEKQETKQKDSPSTQAKTNEIQIPQGKKRIKNTTQYQQSSQKQDSFTDSEQDQDKAQTETVLKMEEQTSQPDTLGNTTQSVQLWRQIESQNTMANQSNGYITGQQLTFMFDNALKLTPQLQTEFDNLNRNKIQTQQQANLNASKLQRAGMDNTKPFTQRIMPTIKFNASEANNLVPNIPWFISKSRPGSPEHEFFQLAAKIWCDASGTCYGNIDRSEAQPLLTQWRRLLPNLNGTLKKIAGYTISRLEQY